MKLSKKFKSIIGGALVAGVTITNISGINAFANEIMPRPTFNFTMSDTVQKDYKDSLISSKTNGHCHTRTFTGTGTYHTYTIVGKNSKSLSSTGTLNKSTQAQYRKADVTKKGATAGDEAWGRFKVNKVTT